MRKSKLHQVLVGEVHRLEAEEGVARSCVLARRTDSGLVLLYSQRHGCIWLTEVKVLDVEKLGYDFAKILDGTPMDDPRNRYFPLPDWAS